MKEYIGTKLIKATPMDRLDYNILRGWELPADENGADEGYLVEYTDGGKPNTLTFKGYVSWSPKEQFDNAYTETTSLTFSMALEAVKRGKRIARKGWNGQGMFVYYVPANRYPAQTPVAKEYFGENSTVPYNAYLAIKTVSETVSTWVPSISDILATDWEVV